MVETFAVDKIAFVNAFNKQSLIKKRIIMLTKKKSKEFLKFKYILLIPVLMGMMFYTSCENIETDKSLSKVNEKRLIKLTMGNYTNKDGTIIKEKIIESKREGYLDVYWLGAKPVAGKEIPFKDLTDAEKEEFEENSMFDKDKEFKEFKFYEFENGTRAVQEIIDWKNLKKS